MYKILHRRTHHNNRMETHNHSQNHNQLVVQDIQLLLLLTFSSTLDVVIRGKFSTNCNSLTNARAKIQGGIRV